MKKLLFVIVCLCAIYCAMSIYLGIILQNTIWQSIKVQTEEELRAMSNTMGCADGIFDRIRLGMHQHDFDMQKACVTIEKNDKQVTFPFVIHWFVGGRATYMYTNSFEGVLENGEVFKHGNIKIPVTVWFSFIDGKYVINKKYEAP